MRHMQYRVLTNALFPLCYLGAAFTRLKSVHITYAKPPRGMTLRQALETSPDAIERRCAGLGQFQIEYDRLSNRHVTLEYTSLRQALSIAKRVASQQSLVGLFDRVTNPSQTTAATLISGRMRLILELACWLACFDKSRAQQAGAGLPTHEFDVLGSWSGASVFHGPGLADLATMRTRLPTGVRLEDVNIVEHDADVVAWATELLNFYVR